MATRRSTPVLRKKRPAAAVATTPSLLTRKDLSLLLAKHMGTITKWERDGMPIAERGRRGKPSLYREVDVRAWLAAREDAAQHSGLVDVAQERAKKERWQGLLTEQTFRIRGRELLLKNDVERVWAAEVTAVRTKLLSWPTSLADKVQRAAATEGLVGVTRVLRDAVGEVLRELADPDRITGPDDDGGEADAA